jgi:hypothetical protein
MANKTEVRHLLIKSEPKSKLKERSAKLWDIQVYLHNLWLEKMATSALYDDATILHGWRCHRCSQTLTLGERKQ